MDLLPPSDASIRSIDHQICPPICLFNWIKQIAHSGRVSTLGEFSALQLISLLINFWLLISSLFHREPVGISVAAPPYLENVESGTNDVAVRVGMRGETAISAAVTLPTSNNILNPNLSGSFKDDDDMPPHHSIYEPIAINTPAAEQGTSSGAIDMADSAFLQTPTQGGIGVAALPHNASDRQFLIWIRGERI